MASREDVLSRYQEMASFELFQLTNFDQAGDDEDAPIHAAAFLGYLDDIEIMLKDDIDINIPGDIGNTPLHFAALNGQKEIIKFLLDSGANPLIRNDYGDTVLDCILDMNLASWFMAELKERGY